MWDSSAFFTIPLVLFQTEKDILLREELEEVKKNHPDKLNLWFTLDKPPQGKGDFFFSSCFGCAVSKQETFESTHLQAEDGARN